MSKAASEYPDGSVGRYVQERWGKSTGDAGRPSPPADEDEPADDRQAPPAAEASRMPTRSVPETTSARETTATAQTPPAAEPAELRPGVTAPAPTEAEPLYRRRDTARPPARETAAAAPVEQPERPAARAVEHEEPVRGAGAVWGASIPDLPAEDLESEIDPMTPGHGIPAVDGPAGTASRTPAAPRRPDAGEFYPSPPRTSAPGTSEPAPDADLGTAPTAGPGGQATGGRRPGDQGTGGDRSVPHLRAAPTHGGTDRDAAAARVT
ncbi:hypothetical protein ACFQ34_22585, partial [Pseudonocardia benzenivorans]